MRFLIAFEALIIAVAYAAPLHEESDLRNESSGLDAQVGNIAKPNEIDDTKVDKYEIIQHHSQEKEDEHDVGDLEDFSGEQNYKESDGIELIALFAMKLQPAHQTPLSKYLKGLPLGIFNRSTKYIMPKPGQTTMI